MGTEDVEDVEDVEVVEAFGEGEASTKKMTGVAHFLHIAVRRPATEGRTKMGFPHLGHLNPTALATTECSAT